MESALAAGVPRTGSCCPRCSRMLREVFTDEALSLCELDNPMAIKDSSSDCAMCSQVWNVMQSDLVLVDQLRKYADSTFNPTSMYHDDGISDVEEYITRTKKVSFTLQLNLKHEEGRQGSVMILKLAAVFGTKGTSRSLKENDRSVQQVFMPFSDLSRLVSTHTISPDVRLNAHQKFALMDSWLRNDTQSPDSTGDAFMPSRILEICGNGVVKVVDTLSSVRAFEDQHQVPFVYIALSHRWGKSQHFTTTKFTLEDRRRGFKVEDLPGTYKDATFVARNLGFKFLWIDSLCIIQDDADDWRTESQQMGDIFRHAKFVIAAHCADADKEGFLARAMRSRDAVGIRIDSRAPFSLYRQGNLAMDVTGSPLSKRGWVLQERFMASRTIHFTDGQIFSETTDELLCEDGSLNTHDLGTSDMRQSSSTQGLTTFRSPGSVPQLRQIFGLGSSLSIAPKTSEGHLSVPLEWLDLVEMYTNCELTKQSDKLMAIAGMARKIQSRTGSVWCAGLWGDILAPSLLWMLGSTKREIRPLPSTAPSWSWAAWDGPVHHPETARKFTPVCSLVCVNTPRDYTQATRTTWLDGPGTLTLNAAMVSFPDGATIASYSTELGPGPARKGALTDGTGALGPVELNQFIRARAITTSYPENEVLGWICIDDVAATRLNFEQSYWNTNSMRQPPPNPLHPTARDGNGEPTQWGIKELRFIPVGRTRTMRPSLQTIPATCLGLFVVPSGGAVGSSSYRRVGVGQVSARHLKGTLVPRKGPLTAAELLRFTRRIGPLSLETFDPWPVEDIKIV
ncbi:heterokaryon incompatibility protein-domain-containing protein [Podospora didyma]|uniref:Heterokaryon incompatibility protein-domain-containing protein n=1 Tax=Podospora didyma TaxID=330526 RepID=A0AAE0K0D1_9PEZI|nr:heterokaryon incompatibility protein-domain-containing protein [Podospora didyma]